MAVVPGGRDEPLEDLPRPVPPTFPEGWEDGMAQFRRMSAHATGRRRRWLQGFRLWMGLFLVLWLAPLVVLLVRGVF